MNYSAKIRTNCSFYTSLFDLSTLTMSFPLDEVPRVTVVSNGMERYNDGTSKPSSSIPPREPSRYSSPPLVLPTSQRIERLPDEYRRWSKHNRISIPIASAQLFSAVCQRMGNQVENPAKAARDFLLQYYDDLERRRQHHSMDHLSYDLSLLSRESVALENCGNLFGFQSSALCLCEVLRSNSKYSSVREIGACDSAIQPWTEDLLSGFEEFIARCTRQPPRRSSRIAMRNGMRAEKAMPNRVSKVTKSAPSAKISRRLK